VTTTSPSAHPTTPAAPAARSTLRAVAVPTEHGGWGLTAEPALLGLLVAPSAAGVALAVAALVAFVVRTPLKIVLVDRRRGRRLDRTRVAARLAALELTVLIALAIAAFALSEDRFWVPAVVAAPLVFVQLWFDMRSRSRRLLPELSGAVGVCAVAAMIVLAAGDSWSLAAALWLVPAARVLSSIPFVRAQVARLHGRTVSPASVLAGDVAAVAAAGSAVAVDPSVVLGATAIAAIVLYQRLTAGRPVPRPAVLGMRQMLFGFGVVALTALSVHIT
jgi:hypothetical protein